MKKCSALALLWAAGAGLLTSLHAADTEPPAIQNVLPQPGGTVSNLTQVTVTFTEPVTGVVPGDFLVNGIPAVSLLGSNQVFTYRFAQPFAGPVEVRWDVNHTLFDLAGNRFDETAPAARWTYTVVDAAPPQLVTIIPVPGAILTGFSQIEIGFDEPVTGLDANDLIVNGLAATNLTPTEAGTYLFQFAPAPAGQATVGWAAGHNIQDTAINPNPFAGGAWAYQVNPALVCTGAVLINEISAENLNGLADEDGQPNDWIELFNPGTNAVSLLGWSLTDDPVQAGKWTFPEVTLSPGQFVVLFASGKDRKAPAGTNKLHTNFRLNAFGSYVGLYNANLPRQLVDAYAPEFPPQRMDFSYGRSPDGPLVYFDRPTPGTTNLPAPVYAGMAAAPSFSAKSGLFNQPFSLVLSTETAGANVYYTLDGSPPGLASMLYTGPIPIAGSPARAVINVRAAAFKPGWLPSAPVTCTYIFPEFVIYQPNNPAGFPGTWDSPCSVSGQNCVDIPADYEMDPQIVNAGTNAAIIRAGLAKIPSLSIVTHVDLLFGPARGVYVRREDWNQQPVNVELITPDGTPGFNVPAGLEVQGGTSPYDQAPSWKSKKLSLRLLFKGDFGARNLEYPLFPDSPVTKFNTLVLDNGLNHFWHYNGSSSPEQQRLTAQYVRDQFISDLQLATGSASAHWRFAHLYLNGLYWGITALHERPDDKFAQEYMGGQAEEYDVLRHNSGNIVAGTNTTYLQMFNLARAGLANNASYEAIQQYLDVPEFIDYMLINIWSGNNDWSHQNWYAIRRRAAGAPGWRYVSWDAEHVLEDLNYDVFTSSHSSDPLAPTELLQLLRQNAEFRVAFGDHVQKLFFNGGILAVETNAPVDLVAPVGNQPAALFLNRIREVDPLLVGESARWGDSGSTTTDRSNNPLTRDRDWLAELFALMGWTNASGHTFNFFPLRSGIVLSKLKSYGLFPSNAAPVFRQYGGRVPAGYELHMTNVQGAGVIYYTTNGVDPRVYGSGAVSAQALAYTNGQPLVLSITMQVKARTLVGTNWSALTEALFQVGGLASPLRITEIMYNPPGGDAYEYIELANAGATPLDLSGLSFDGISYVFPPGSILEAGGLLVLGSAANTNVFKLRYPGVVVFGWFGGALNNGGERIAIKSASGQILVSVNYDDANGWPIAADGGGYSLEIIDPRGDPDDPANWRASATLNGSPGLPNSPFPPAAIRFNEIMADNLTAVSNGNTFPDWIELYNPSLSPATLTGWSLTDDSNPRKFVFPDNTTIPAAGYLVLWCDDATNTTPGLHAGFGLGRRGDSLFLFDAATNRIDSISYGLQIPDLSLGSINGSWQLTQPTPGSDNLPIPLADPSNLIINEWLANPVPGADDWIELFNRAAQPVSLRGIYLAAGNDLSQLAALSFVPSRGYVQLWADGLPGPDHLDFRLPAAGTTIVLYDDTGSVIDRVSYTNQLEGVSQGRLPDAGSTIVSFDGSASPGASNYVVSYTGPVLNEMLAWTTGTNLAADWIEIHNPNSNAWSLALLSLSDSRAQPGQWLFPTGATLAANAYLVIWCDGTRPPATNWGAELNTGFSLSRESGGVFLFNSTGQLLDSVEYGFQVPNLSIGRTGGQWQLLQNPTPGAPNAAPATLGQPASLRLNEWLAGAPNGQDWFELFNADSSPVALGGLYLTDDLSIAGQTRFQVGPLSFIGARGFVRFMADAQPSRGADHVNFSLEAHAEAIRLLGPDLSVLDTVSFGLQLPGISQGRLPDGALSVLDFPGSPTPGASNYRRLPNALINEVLPSSGSGFENAIELYNPLSAAVDLSGWFLSDSQANFKKFLIPGGTLLPGGGWHVFYQNQFDSGAFPFHFNPAAGGEVWLSEADAAGNLTGFRAHAAFGPAEPGVSFGRYPTCSGSDFTALSQPSFGAEPAATLEQFRTGRGALNADPQAPALMITELMYEPVLSGGLDNTVDEFIEFYNPGGTPVPLFDPASPDTTWRLSGGVDFRFPTNTLMGAYAYLLVVHFDPQLDPVQLAAFHSRYSVPFSVPVLGPYGGKLNNDGESIALYRPASSLDPTNTANIPFLLVDRVDYVTDACWTTNAAGTGLSLHRNGRYGNYGLNWFAALPTPGGPSPAAPSLLPRIIEQPLDRAVPAGTDVMFNVAAYGSGVLSYQWRFNGQPINGATNRELSLLGVQAAQTGSYSVFVANGAGSVTSAEATLELMELPLITTQPQGVVTNSGSMLSLSVGAGGQGPWNYQWRRDGQWLAGATNPVLQFGRVQVDDSGAYSVMVGNAAGIVASAVAWVEIFQGVDIVAQPRGSTNNAGTNVSFSVSAVGTGTLRYQWQINGTDLVGATNATLVLTNVQVEDAGQYTVEVADERGAILSEPATLLVLMRPVITLQPEGATVAVGTRASFVIGARGTLPMQYRWRRIGTYLVTNTLYANSCTYTIDPVQTNDGSFYNVALANVAGMATQLSSNAFLTVVVPPTNQVALVGTDVVFQVSVYGRAGVRYQWQFGGADLPGATNASLTLTNVQLTNSGEYQVVVNVLTNRYIAPAAFAASLIVTEGAPRLRDPRVLAGGEFEVWVDGPADQVYELECSTNLVPWVPQAIFRYTNGAVPFRDPGAVSARQRFYRARLSQ